MPAAAAPAVAVRAPAAPAEGRTTSATTSVIGARAPASVATASRRVMSAGGASGVAAATAQMPTTSEPGAAVVTDGAASDVPAVAAAEASATGVAAAPRRASTTPADASAAGDDHVHPPDGSFAVATLRYVTWRSPPPASERICVHPVGGDVFEPLTTTVARRRSPGAIP